jgi:hypothetical protein
MLIGWNAMGSIIIKLILELPLFQYNACKLSDLKTLK